MTRLGRERAMRAVAAVMFVAVAGCGPRVLISTGTTLGLKATPGNVEGGRPPQVTLGYKRAELSLVPTRGTGATRLPDGRQEDAFSTLAAFDFQTRWFGKTELSSFISTGFAAQEIQKNGTFADAFVEKTLPVLEPDLQARRAALSAQGKVLDEAGAKAILDRAGLPLKANVDARASLWEYIFDARTDPQLKLLEKAFAPPST
jgi:hypothetical protein